MDPRLKRMSDEAEEHGRRDLRAVLSLIGEKGYPKTLVDALPEARELWPACVRAAADAQRKFPIAVADKLCSDRDGLKRHAGELIKKTYRDYINPMLTKIPLAQRMEERIQRIQSMVPADVRGWTLESVARPHIESCGGLLSELQGLREFPEKLADDVKAIDYQLNLCSDKPAQPTESAPAPRLSDQDEGEIIISNCDSRS